MTRSQTRRRYLAVAGVGTLTALAGCADEGPGEEEDEPTDEQTENSDEQAENNDGEPVEDVDHEDPDGSVAFVAPEDGDEVTSPVEIEMEVEELELQPAPDENETDEAGAPDDGAGHLHVIVDHDCVEPGYVIPFEEGYHHLSDGERETELELEPGEYDLCAQAGDDQHNAYDLTDEITIEVVEENDDDDDGGNETDG